MKSSYWLFVVTLFFCVLDVAFTQLNMLHFGDSGTMEPGQPLYYLNADAATSNVGPADELQRTQRSFWNKLFKKGLRDLFDDDDDECCYNNNNNNYDVGNGDAYNVPPPPPPPQQYGGYDPYMHPLMPMLHPLKALEPWGLFNKPFNFAGNRGGYGLQRGPPSGPYKGNAAKQYGAGGGGGNKNYALPSNNYGNKKGVYGGGYGGGGKYGNAGGGNKKGNYGGGGDGYGDAGGDNKKGGYGGDGGYGGAAGGYGDAGGGNKKGGDSYGATGGGSAAPAYESNSDAAPATYDNDKNTDNSGAADYGSDKDPDSYSDNLPAAPTTYEEPSAPAPESYNSDDGSEYNAAPEESYDSKPAAEPAAVIPGYNAANYATGYGKQAPIIYQPIIYVSPQFQAATGYGAASQAADKEQYAETAESSHEEDVPAAEETPTVYEESTGPAAEPKYNAPVQTQQQQQQYPQQQQNYPQQQTLSAPCCASQGCQCGMPCYGLMPFVGPVYSPCHSCGSASAYNHPPTAAHNAYVASPHYAQAPATSYTAPTSYAAPTSYGGPGSQAQPMAYSAPLSHSFNPAQALTAVSASYTVISPSAGGSYSAPVQHSAAPTQSYNSGGSAGPAYSAPVSGCCGDPLKMSLDDQPYRDCPELFANYNNQLSKRFSY